MTVATMLEGLVAFDIQKDKPHPSQRACWINTKRWYIAVEGFAQYTFYLCNGNKVPYQDVTRDMLDAAILAFTRKGDIDNAAQR